MAKSGEKRWLEAEGGLRVRWKNTEHGIQNTECEVDCGAIIVPHMFGMTKREEGGFETRPCNLITTKMVVLLYRFFNRTLAGECSTVSPSWRRLSDNLSSSADLITGMSAVPLCSRRSMTNLTVS